MTLSDSTGTELESIDLSEESMFYWEAPSTGGYYVSIGEWEVSSYTLEVSIGADHGADHGNDIDSATAISVGEAVEGAIDYEWRFGRFPIQCGCGADIPDGRGTRDA